MRHPFRYFKASPDIICLAVRLYIRFALSLRHVEDLLRERGFDVSCETAPLLLAERRQPAAWISIGLMAPSGSTDVVVAGCPA